MLRGKGGNQVFFQKGEIADGGFHAAAFSEDLNLRADRAGKGFFGVAHGDGDGAKHGGEATAGDNADLGGRGRFGRGCRCRSHGKFFACDAQADEESGDGLVGVHAGDDFLSEVAAFGDSDGAEVPVAGLHGEIIFGDIDAIEGGAGFDTGGVEGGPADDAKAGRIEGIGFGVLGGGGGGAGKLKSLPDGDELIARHDEFELLFAAEIVAEDRDGGSGENSFGVAEGLVEGFDTGVEDFLEKLGGFGADEGEAAELLGSVQDADIFGEDVFLHHVDELDGEAVVHFDESGFFGMKDVEVHHDSAFEVEEVSIAALAGGEGFGVVGDFIVEEGEAVLAGEDDHAAMGGIHESDAFADGGVFGFHFAVAFDDAQVRAVGQERGFLLLVCLLQRIDGHGHSIIGILPGERLYTGGRVGESVAALEHLRCDRDSNFRRVVGAEVESDGAEKCRDFFGRNAVGEEVAFEGGGFGV